MRTCESVVDGVSLRCRFLVYLRRSPAVLRWRTVAFRPVGVSETVKSPSAAALATDLVFGTQLALENCHQPRCLCGRRSRVCTGLASPEYGVLLA